MSRRFNKEEQDMLWAVSCNVDEVFEDLRKGVAQTFYVFQVEATATYFSATTYKEEYVDEEYVGYWKMKHSHDISDEDLRDCLHHYAWVRCFKKEIVSYEWEEL